MTLATGPIALAYGTSPTEALKNKFASGASETWDETLGASTAYFINSVDKPPLTGIPLTAAFRRSADVAGGKLGYHYKGGEALYIILRARAQITIDIVGGANSVIFVQVAVYDRQTGAFKDNRTFEYADVYTTAPQGFSADPVAPANRDAVICAVGPPLAADEVGVTYGMTRIVLASD